jgi:hypothetical protein
MRSLFKPCSVAAAVASALTLSACGGGGDAAPAAPVAPPAPPPPTAAMHQQAIALAEAPFVFGDMTVGPIWYGTDETLRVLASADVCGSGSASSRLDGAAVAAGTVLPTGSHTFETTFATCAVLPTRVLTGTASVAYSAPTSVATAMTATATANGVRWQGKLTSFTGSAGVNGDYTGSGTLAFSYTESVSGNVLSGESTLRPAAGATVTNNDSRATLAWVSGDVRELVTLNATTFAPLTYTTDYRALTLTVGSATVVIDGSLTKTFSGNAMTPSGQATLRVAGTPVGTLRYAADGRLTATLSADVPTW